MVEAPMVRTTGRRRPDRGTIGRSGTHRDYRMSRYPHMTDWRRQRDAGAFEALSPVNCGPKVRARTLNRDIEAVRNAIAEAWSSSQAERPANIAYHNSS